MTEVETATATSAATDELVKRCAIFVNVISASANKLQLPPGGVVAMFGLFAQQVIALFMEEGDTREVATARVNAAFADGLELKTVSTEVQPGGVA
jgi:hypothetical protein